MLSNVSVDTLPVPEFALRPPCDSFLADLDAPVDARFELHCLGEFVIAQLHDFDRVTVDPARRRR